MSTRKERREADRQRRAAVVTTGPMPAMCQDADRKLSQWLAGRPGAMRHAREAAAEISKTNQTEDGGEP